MPAGWSSGSPPPGEGRGRRRRIERGRDVAVRRKGDGELGGKSKETEEVR